jgi:serine/threonine protein kinase
VEPFEKYRQLKKIGEGGMGIVYQAWDPAVDRPVAIKSVQISSEGNVAERAEFRERLLREGRAAGSLSHPNIVTIYNLEFLQETGQAYIVMEFVEGENLDGWLSAAEPPGPHVVLDIIRQSASALDYAHAKGVVHRDVKPSNILIRNDGVVKLVDFGLAKLAASSKLTRTGSSLGTPHYMSAEQIKGEDVGPRSDQYSLAVCAYQMMTGTRPFVGDTIHSLFNRIMNAAPAPAENVNSTLGTEIGRVLTKALSKVPQERHESCMEFARCLERACAMTPAWRPKTAGAAMKAGAGGAGGVAVETPLPTPVEPNRPGRIPDNWLTEIVPAAATPSPSPYRPPAATGRETGPAVLPPDEYAVPPAKFRSRAMLVGLVTLVCLLVAGLVALITSQLKPKPEPAPPSPIVVKPPEPSVPKTKARRSSKAVDGVAGAVPGAVPGSPAKKRQRAKKDAAAADAATAEPGSGVESKKGAADSAKPAEPDGAIDITSRPPSLRQPPKKQ